MDIYLIRHTRTATLPGLCYGRTDVPLADSFTDDAQRLHHKLPDLSNDKLIISSPSKRCLSLAQTFQGKLIIDPRLHEIDFGAWENRRFEDIDAAKLKHWTDNFVLVAPPNGESFTDLCQRVAQFWVELLATMPAEQVILTTHAGVIRALFAHVLQLPQENAFKIRVDLGSVHKLQHSGDYTYIHYLNR